GFSVTATMTLDVIAATTTVPWVTNMTESAAGTAITNAGLVVSGVSEEYHATIAAGRIFSQTPGGNTTLTRGSSVALAVSLGPQPSILPTVGSIITLKAVNGKYVSATYSTNNALIANKTNNLTNYERFKVINATNCIALQCMGNSKFVSCETPSGSKPMTANRSTIGSYEKFKLVESGTNMAIQSVLTTNYVSAISNGSAPLQASQTYIGSYEKFTWKVE
ncbi:MAG: PASTA domain-containing protein, partial [Kiritimatiellaceae bacterium]|nr:PASTA domain-containing protein [Kiritimatiellaceae bacterium]